MGRRPSRRSSNWRFGFACAGGRGKGHSIQRVSDSDSDAVRAGEDVPASPLLACVPHRRFAADEKGQGLSLAAAEFKHMDHGVAIPEHIVAESTEQPGDSDHPVSPSCEQPPKEFSSLPAALSSPQTPKSLTAHLPKLSTPLSSHDGERMPPASPQPLLQEGAAPPPAESSPPQDRSPGISISMLSKVSLKAAKLKPALLAEWDLSHVLSQLSRVKQGGVGAAATSASDPKRRSVFRENPNPADISEYHLGIAEHPAPTHLEFQCGRYCVTNEGTGLRPAADAAQPPGKEASSLQLPEQWWVSSETAAAAIKKVARQELEEGLQKDRSKQDEAKGLRLSSSSGAAAKKKPTLAAGTISLGAVLEQAALTKTPLSNINVLQIQRISDIYDFQDAEEYDAKAQGHHPREARLRIGGNAHGNHSSFAAASPFSSRHAGAAGTTSSVDAKADGAPVLNTEREEPISLTATLLLGNEFGRCELPETLFRVRRYDLLADETRELFVKELQLALQLPAPNQFRKFAGAWLDGVHGLLLFANMGFGSFVQVLRNRGPLPASLLPSVARMLVHALKQMHALKHVHNAIEPAAIHVHTDGEVRLGNLRFAAPVYVNRYNQTYVRATESAGEGEQPPRIASFRTPSGSSALQFSGPWTSMSPERLLGLECSYASDVWSLGVCLLHLAIGSCPYLESETRCISALKNAVIGGALRERLLIQDEELLDENFHALVVACLHPMPQKRPSLASILGDYPFMQKGQFQSQERMRSWLVGDMSFFAEDAAVAAQEELQRYTLLAQRTVTAGGGMLVFSNAHIENRMPHVPVATALRLNPSGVLLIGNGDVGGGDSPSAPKFVAWAKYGPSCNLEPLLSGASSSVWVLMVNADKQRGCFHLCLQSGERVDVLAASEEQAMLWVKGVGVVLEAAELQKSSLRIGVRTEVRRTKSVDDRDADKAAAPPLPSLPTISQSRGLVGKSEADGLLDVAAMKWERIQESMKQIASTVKSLRAMRPCKLDVAALDAKPISSPTEGSPSKLPTPSPPKHPSPSSPSFRLRKSFGPSA